MPTQHILVSFYRVKQKSLEECFLWYPSVCAFNNQIFFIITHFHAPLNFAFKIKPFKISNFNR
ncbi:hypothetical protein B0X28_02895 [Helicobacter pylori]|nr:hypothetical protein B0X28_02895 [Helicobacter pylori]